jgi:hypothetical protein
MNVEELHKDLFVFFKTCKVKETSFEFEGEDLIKKISLNGYYSKDIIETVISCLFQKGFDNLKNNIPYSSLKGEYEIEKIVYEYSGRLKQELEKLNFGINSCEITNVSNLKMRYDNIDLSDYKEQVKSFMDYEEFDRLIQSEIQSGIMKIESVKQEITQKFREVKSKADSNFKIDPDIIEKFLPEIFVGLKDSNQYEGVYKDFEKLMRGITPTNKIGIKEITSMGTFINWLISVNLIPAKHNKKIDWKFIADNLYIIGNSKKLESNQFSKNGSRNHNNDIYAVLKKHETVIKAYLDQHK